MSLSRWGGRGSLDGPQECWCHDGGRLDRSRLGRGRLRHGYGLPRHQEAHDSPEQLWHGNDHTREKNLQGEWLTRFYVDMNDLELKRQQCTNVAQDANPPGTGTIHIKTQQKRSRITVDDIYDRLAEIFAPFRMALKQGTEADWYTAYAVGQRVASKFAKADSCQHPRIFLVGDGMSESHIILAGAARRGANSRIICPSSMSHAQPQAGSGHERQHG